MTRLLRLALVLVSVASAVLLAACGSSSETATIGTSEVTIPGHPDSLIETVRATAEQEPYEDWALDCIVGQFEKIISPAEEEKLKGISEKEFGEFLEPHLTAINHACEKPGRHLLDPDATEAELAVVRSSEVVGIRALLKAAEVPAGERECIEAKVAGLPGPRLVALIEADEARREAMFEQIGAPCFRRGASG